MVLKESPGETAHAAAELGGQLRPEAVVAAEELHGRHRDDRPADQRIDVALPRSGPRPAPGSAPANCGGLPALHAGVRPVDLRLEVAAVDRDGGGRQAALHRGDAEVLDRIGHRRRQHRGGAADRLRHLADLAVDDAHVHRVGGVAHRLQRDAVGVERLADRVGQLRLRRRDRSPRRCCGWRRRAAG